MNLTYSEFVPQQSFDAKIGINPEIGQFVIDNKVKTIFGYFPFVYYLLDVNKSIWCSELEEGEDCLICKNLKIKIYECERIQLGTKSKRNYRKCA